MGIKKNIQKLLSEPTQMRLEEVINVLYFLGYKLERIKGSHFQFTKTTGSHLTIASHNNIVKKIYLKSIKRVIIDQRL